MPESQAASVLRTIRGKDVATARDLRNVWVPQVSSKCTALTRADIRGQDGTIGVPDGTAEAYRGGLESRRILAFHLAMDQRWPLLLVRPADIAISESNAACAGTPMWISLVNRPYRSASGAVSWCVSHNLPYTECVARPVRVPGASGFVAQPRRTGAGLRVAARAYLCTTPVGALPALIGPDSSRQATIALQTLLTDMGLHPGPIDGQYGPVTQEAVREYQAGVGLDADGQVGALTWGALRDGNCTDTAASEVESPPASQREYSPPERPEPDAPAPAAPAPPAPVPTVQYTVVPDVVGLDPTSAAQLLANNGLRLANGAIGGYGTVSQQSPTPGSRVPVGSSVTVMVRYD